jgi:hypothetical protein
MRLRPVEQQAELAELDPSGQLFHPSRIGREKLVEPSFGVSPQGAPGIRTRVSHD